MFTTFDIAFKHYHVGWLTNVLSLLIAFGALASVMSWISGPSRGLLWTAKEGQLPDFMKKKMCIRDRPTTVGEPVVPEEACRRTICDIGTAKSPYG